MQTADSTDRDGVENGGPKLSDQDEDQAGPNQLETGGDGEDGHEEESSKSRDAGGEKEDEDEDILVMTGPDEPTTTEYSGNVPPPLVELYHGA